MRTNLNEQLTYFILGVPRVGTTIVANLFNSLDDGFCLMEPHWFAKAIEDRDVDFMEWWKKAKTHIHLAGYKETYRLWHEMCEELIAKHTPRVDFFVIVFRDPVYVHSSQRALGWDEWDHPACFNESYERLDKLAQDARCVTIVYEDFVRNPLDYLNARLPFQIEGPLHIAPTDAEFGDPFANRSTEIRMSKREVCISPKEIEGHAPGRAIWQKYRSN